MNAVTDDTAVEPDPRPVFAFHAGRCWRCTKRFGKGAEIVIEGRRKHAHLECFHAGVEPEPVTPAEDLLEEARHALNEIAKVAKNREPSETDRLDQVYERAVGTGLSITQQKGRGRV